MVETATRGQPKELLIASGEFWKLYAREQERRSNEGITGLSFGLNSRSLEFFRLHQPGIYSWVRDLRLDRKQNPRLWEFRLQAKRQAGSKTVELVRGLMAYLDFVDSNFPEAVPAGVFSVVKTCPRYYHPPVSGFSFKSASGSKHGGASFVPSGF